MLLDNNLLDSSVYLTAGYFIHRLYFESPFGLAKIRCDS